MSDRSSDRQDVGPRLGGPDLLGLVAVGRLRSRSLIYSIKEYIVITPLSTGYIPDSS